MKPAKPLTERLCVMMEVDFLGQKPSKQRLLCRFRALNRAVQCYKKKKTGTGANVHIKLQAKGFSSAYGNNLTICKENSEF